MFSPQLLIIIGIVLVVIAVIGFLVYMIISRKSKARLEEQLNLEYGKKRN